jgi:hypothetical protein
VLDRVLGAHGGEGEGGGGGRGRGGGAGEGDTLSAALASRLKAIVQVNNFVCKQFRM